MKHSELSVFKENGHKITCLTAYDASMAKLLDQAGVDAIFGPGTNITDAARRVLGLIEQRPNMK